MKQIYLSILLIFAVAGNGFFSHLAAQPYPDQHYLIERGDSLMDRAESTLNMELANNGEIIQLAEGATAGYIILKPQQAKEPFNRALPSWNGIATNSNCGFKVFVRLPDGSGWTPWLTVGFWKTNIWNAYGTTSFSYGDVEIDYLVMAKYIEKWQFKVVFKRTTADVAAPGLKQLSFFVSDSRTTRQMNYSQLLEDNPAEVFVPTDFFYQYELDPEIGQSICSPTTVSMILRSYDIPVDPVPFARATKDPYWGIFGGWPRVVQNASEYGLNGVVNRYRNWSAARQVLANDGRIALSIGEPLYGGHLVMLAGFDEAGNPVVHDPAKSNGYSYVFDKYDLSKSWFDKGGIAYTFYQSDSFPITQVERLAVHNPEKPELDVYPNPVSGAARISFSLPASGRVALQLYNLSGQCLENIGERRYSAGRNEFRWQPESGLKAGIYILSLRTPFGKAHKKIVLKSQ